MNEWHSLLREHGNLDFGAAGTISDAEAAKDPQRHSSSQHQALIIIIIIIPYYVFCSGGRVYSLTKTHTRTFTSTCSGGSSSGIVGLLPR